MPIKVRIWWDDPSSGYALTSPYDKRLIEGMSLVIPSSNRYWDAQAKIWYIGEQYGDAVRMIAERVYGVGNVSFTSKVAAQQAAARDASQSQQKQYIPPPIVSGVSQMDRCAILFVRLLPYEVAKKAYREASHLLHPDKQGGSHEKMAELNQSWSVIEKEVYKK